MKRLIYFNKPMNIIVVIIREYTKKSRRHWTKPPPPPAKKRFARVLEKQEERSKSYFT